MAKVKKKAAKSKASSKAAPKAKRRAGAAKAKKGASKARKAKAERKKTKAKPAKAKAVKAKAKPVKAKAVKAKAKPVKTKAKPVKTKPLKSKPAPAEQPKASEAAKPQSVKPAAPAKASSPSKPPAPSVEIGSSAPAFTLKDQSGAVISSADLSGKPYVLYFYPKDDTSGCTAEACAFRDSGPKFGDRGVRVIGVSPDSEASHAKFAGKYGLPFTLLSDPEKQLISAYGAWVEKQNYGRTYMGVQRSTFLVGADGKVQKAWRGVKVPGHVEAVLAATQPVEPELEW
jgi:thioredoxin-dependent peroxiredoxin